MSLISLLFLLPLILGFLLVQLSGFATTVYLHRSLTHESFKLKRPSEMIFRWICWLMIGTVPKEWVAVHRKHHAFTDAEGDPHSPIMEGFWNIQILNVIYVAKEMGKIDLKHWARGVPDYGWLDRHYKLGLVVGFLSSALGFGLLGILVGSGFLWGLLFGVIVNIMYGFWYIGTVSTINGLCHVWGYKTFKDTDAYNIRTVAFLTLGEGLHNNHHKNQRSPCLRTGEKTGETDLGWRMIKLLDKMGQVYEKSELWPANPPR